MRNTDNFIDHLGKEIERGHRVSAGEALRLFESKDILGLGRLADSVRQRNAGEIVTLVANAHICYTTICVHECRYCTFRRKAGEEGSFTLGLENIEELAGEAGKSEVPEVLLHGAIHPELDLRFFEEALTRIRKIVPQVKILGFSPVEIDHFARQENLSVERVLKVLREAGLAAITGGGAEIFSPRVRERLGCAEKISGKRWLEIMEIAHRCDIRSNASLLYGAGESCAERIEHLEDIRQVQDGTGGFTHFLPFAFNAEGFPRTTGYDDIKMIAVSRIFLDNFAHIRAYWSHLGLPGAQIALAFGADDLNGLRSKGRIIHSSGGIPSSLVEKSVMIEVIRDAGRIPAERDILFNIVKLYDTPAAFSRPYED